VLRDATLRIERGERVAIVGPNGAGKTTLLQTMGGLIAPVSGTIAWEGAARLPQVAYVWQGLHLVQRLSVIENVLVGAVARSRSPRTWIRKFPAVEIARARALLERVGISHLAEERADRLSGGERQRVAIARALMQDSALMLADEPTASLDWNMAREVAELLSGLVAERGMALITVAHDATLLGALCDRVIVVRGGRIAFDGPLTGLDLPANIESWRGPPR
jgi:phosphonate transport system ATP-binding protein